MNRKIKISGLVLLVLILLTAASVFIFRAQIIKFIIPNVRQIGNINIAIINDTTFINTKLVVKNNVFLKIKIDTIKYEVSLMDKMYLNNKKFIGIVLPGNGVDTFDFALKIPHASIIKDLKNERKKGDSANYSINVFIQYSSVFGKSEFPFCKSAKIKIPQPPEVEIVDIKYKKIRLKSIQAFVKIKIVNHSAFILELKTMTYSMDILKMGKMDGNYKKAIKIKPFGTSYVTLKIKMDINNMLKTAFQVLFDNDTYDYNLSLKAIMKSIQPFEQSFQIDLEKTGRMELKK